MSIVEAQARGALVSVRAPTAGRIAARLVEPGARVRAGDWLAAIADPELDAALVRGRSALPPGGVARSPALEHLRQDARQLASELEVAQQDLAMVRQLARANALPGLEAGRVARRVERLSATLAQHERLLAATELDLAEPKPAGIESHAERAMREIVRAPVSGVLRRWAAESGDRAPQGSLLAEIDPG